MTRFALAFPHTEIRDWAAHYDYPAEDAMAMYLMPAIRERGYLTYDDLMALGRWKSPRSGPRIAANDPADVAAITAVALTTANERLRIEGLTLLSGVAWPMASTILHWCHVDRYPILDFRALWSLGIDPLPRYDFPFWRAYTAYCRELADQAQVSMRELDRALWQYCYEKRPKR